jgi:hypothetical protein
LRVLLRGPTGGRGFRLFRRCARGEDRLDLVDIQREESVDIDAVRRRAVRATAQQGIVPEIARLLVAPSPAGEE